MRNRKKKSNPAVGFGIAAIAAALCLAALASDTSQTETPVAVDAEQYADFIENEVFNIQDLAEGAEIQRRRFNRMTPPGFSWVQPMFPSVVPFDAENFDEKFLDELLGEDKNSVAIYPLSLTQDPKTRETLVFNADGKLIATIPADQVTREWPENADPARVILLLDLLPVEDVEPYLYTESCMEESLSQRDITRQVTPGGAIARSLGAGEFGICDTRKTTNGTMRITVTNGLDAAEVYAYTVAHTSSVVVATWTNEYDEVITSTNVIWHPVSPPFNGIQSDWASRATNLVLTGGTGVWEDTNISSNDRVRFYAAAKRVDSDEDGLSDGSEILLHRTEPGMADTDGDGIPDGAEIALGLDPLDTADAAADPDADELTNLEEYELGTDINNSNEVILVYFSNNTNTLPAAKALGGSGNVQYVTWSNFQAKASCTIREKEGYPEFTTYGLPPSDPPKWYLNREWFYQASGVWYDATYYSTDHITKTEAHYCLKEFNPNGWPDNPTNHFCTGSKYYNDTWSNETDWGQTIIDYTYDQPNEYLPVTTTFYIGGDVTGSNTIYRDTCEMPGKMNLNTLSHTETYKSNDWVLLTGATNPGAFEMERKSLTNEYTDEMLLFYTKADLGLMPTMDNLAWDQRWVRDEHRDIPYTQTLPTNEMYSVYNMMFSDQTSNRLQKLRYRWGIPTDSSVVYKMIWWEKFTPENASLPSSLDQKGFNILGTGSTEYSDPFDIQPPTNEGCIYPVPMENILIVDLDVDATYDGSIDDTDDYSEESPGGLVVHSDSWDDRPLTKIIIQKVQPEDLDCSVDLSISAGISKIELFEDFFGTQQITFFPVTYQNSDLPKTLWVRSWDTSDALGDIEFQLQLNTIVECQDIVRVTSIEVEYTNTVNQKYGFDGETELPIYWKSIKWSDSDTAYAKMDPIAASTRVKFSSSVSDISVSPSSASTSPETLAITSLDATDSSIGADLGAVDYLRAAFLNVKNFSLVEKRVALYHVVEGGSNISPTDSTSAASIQTYLNDSVYNQGVASFTVHDFGMTNVNYDLNSDGKMEYDYPNPLSSEAQEIRAAIPLPPTYDYVVYHVHDITGVNGLASRIDTYAFVRDGSLSIRNLIAHELGHAFGNLPDGGPYHWLMNNTGNCDEGKLFLPKAHWDLIDSRHR